MCHCDQIWCCMEQKFQRFAIDLENLVFVEWIRYAKTIFIRSQNANSRRDRERETYECRIRWDFATGPERFYRVGTLPSPSAYSWSWKPQMNAKFVHKPSSDGRQCQLLFAKGSPFFFVGLLSLARLFWYVLYSLHCAPYSIDAPTHSVTAKLHLAQFIVGGIRILDNQFCQNLDFGIVKFTLHHYHKVIGVKSPFSRRILNK